MTRTISWMALALLLGCDDTTTKTDSDSGTTDTTKVTDTTDVTDTGTDKVPTSCTEPGTMCVSLSVPKDYAGTPREVIAGFYTALPPAGPPNHSLAPFIPQEVKAGGTVYLFWDADVPAKGDFELYVVLYDKTGGTFIPTPNVDYVAFTDAPITLDGSAVNVALDLSIATAL